MHSNLKKSTPEGEREMGDGSFSRRSRLAPTSLVLLLLLLLLVSPSQSDQKVALSLYYEALCPYCANFIVSSLSKVFDAGLISIVDLKLVPWGNGWILPDGSLSCQVTATSTPSFASSTPVSLRHFLSSVVFLVVIFFDLSLKSCIYV